MNNIISIAAIVGCMLLYSSAAQGGVDECTEQQIAKLSCVTIEGELQFWNGWPPFLRIESKDRKHVYGLVYSDDERLPNELQSFVESLQGSNGKSGYGSFVICSTGSVTSVPYDDRQIEIVCLKSMIIGGRK